MTSSLWNAILGLHLIYLIAVDKGSPVCWGRCSLSAPRGWGRDSTCAGMAGRFQCSQINTDRREWDGESTSERRARRETSPHSPPERGRTENQAQTFIMWIYLYSSGRKQGPNLILPKVLWRFDTQEFNSVQFSQNSTSVSLVSDVVGRF